ncbi:hypothetical protein [Streptomyces sp. MUM 16J]|uniref:hypothetical protein n=1 Tax=Streptomyces sp. MUM 16J TaxID=2791988 RepID=UPI0005B862DA|nr:hypothetical protein [Streptomyces sp. MUM 16J]MCH0560227.1 hypothetical protein [Streptomyces sp. MUM 16J]
MFPTNKPFHGSDRLGGKLDGARAELRLHLFVHGKVRTEVMWGEQVYGPGRFGTNGLPGQRAQPPYECGCVGRMSVRTEAPDRPDSGRRRTR